MLKESVANTASQFWQLSSLLRLLRGHVQRKRPAALLLITTIFYPLPIQAQHVTCRIGNRSSFKHGPTMPN